MGEHGFPIFGNLGFQGELNGIALLGAEREGGGGLVDLRGGGQGAIFDKGFRAHGGEFFEQGIRDVIVGAALDRTGDEPPGFGRVPGQFHIQIPLPEAVGADLRGGEGKEAAFPKLFSRRHDHRPERSFHQVHPGPFPVTFEPGINGVLKRARPSQEKPLGFGRALAEIEPQSDRLGRREAEHGVLDLPRRDGLPDGQIAESFDHGAHAGLIRPIFDRTLKGPPRVPALDHGAFAGIGDFHARNGIGPEAPEGARGRGLVPFQDGHGNDRDQSRAEVGERNERAAPRHQRHTWDSSFISDATNPPQRPRGRPTPGPSTR